MGPCDRTRMKRSLRPGAVDLDEDALVREQGCCRLGSGRSTSSSPSGPSSERTWGKHGQEILAFRRPAGAAFARRPRAIGWIRRALRRKESVW